MIFRFGREIDAVHLERGEVVNKVVVFGGGAMGTGVIKGLIKGAVVEPENIIVGEILPERREYLKKELGVTPMEEAWFELPGADMAFIVVNPWQVREVTARMKEHMGAETIVVCVASGAKLTVLGEQLGFDKKILRLMPNTLVEAGVGYNGVTYNSNVDDEDRARVEAAIEALGPTMYISEDMFQPFASYGCAGPMWVLKLIEAMIDAGVQSGFSREDARAMVLENVEGTAKTLKITGEHPAARVDKMTSPGGITIEGVKKLEEDGFAGTVMASVEAAVNKGNNV